MWRGRLARAAVRAAAAAAPWGAGCWRNASMSSSGGCGGAAAKVARASSHQGIACGAARQAASVSAARSPVDAWSNGT